MKLSWTVVVLVILGLVAAFCAALLITTIQVQASRKAGRLVPVEFDVVVARDSIDSWTVLEADHVGRKRVPLLELPPDYFSDESQVIGKRLVSSVRAGQVITKNLFPREGTGLSLAASLPPGMRAVSVSLKGDAGLEGLIYPGCLVDVLATFKLEQTSKLGEAVSTTLLEKIPVLAVENIAVGQNLEPTQEGVDKAAGQRAVAARGMFVTLQVDAKQAEALQLAIDRGTVSLAMRSPEDTKTGDKMGTLLNQGRLAEYAGSLEAYVAPEQPEATRSVGGPPSSAPSADSGVRVSAGPGQAPETKQEPHWTVDILRGVTREIRELKLPSWR